MTTVEKAKTRIMIFLLPVFCLSSIYGFMHLNSLIPEFADTFESFGEELPLFTQLFLNFHTAIFVALSILSAVSLIATYFPKAPIRLQSTAFYYSLANPAVLVLFLLLVLAAMYLPIFTLD